MLSFNQTNIYETSGAVEETGVVVDVQNGLARVRIVRSSSCQSCATKDTCPFNSIGKRDWLVWARNEMNAQKGDTVKVSISPRSYLAAAAIIFILPVSVLLIAYIVAQALGVVEKLSVAISSTLALLSYLVIRAVDRHRGENSNFTIVEIVRRGRNQSESLSEIC